MSNPRGAPNEPPEADDSGSGRFDSDAPNHSRAAYESLVNTLPLSLLIKDTDGRRLFANETYLKTRGCTLDQVIGKRDIDLFPADIAAAYTQDDRHVIATGQSMHSVEQSIRPDGQRRWIERIKSPVLDARQRVIGVQLLFWDVTDRHLAESELKYERQLLTALLQNIPDSIYFKDTASRFVRISEAMAQKFGLSGAAEAIGKTDADIFTEIHAAAARQDELRIMRTKAPVVDLVERETWPERADTWCMSTKMPLVDDDDKVIGTFGISRDITELIKYEDELRKARDAANSANRAKSDFLANMSHEIRTPMNAIIGMSELLAQTNLNSEQRDYINLVRDSAESLLRLLNEILDFSKIESRKLQLESIPFSLRHLIDRSCQTLAIRAATKKIELKCHVAPELPDRWIGDPGRLRQIMINLIGNAIKFTDEGEVCVEVMAGQSRADAPAGHKPLRFSVRDTGIGIHKDKHAAILDPFTQADTSTTRRFGGTGLGLTISRDLVELMQGELKLDSTPGVGTTFYFTAWFPSANDDAGLDPEEIVDPMISSGAEDFPICIPLRVLVAEDGLANQHVAIGMLRAAGHSPVVVSDGREAVARIQSESFDMILMDMHMPIMDGIEATKAIRMHERVTGTHIPIIALTAAAMKEDADACLQAGMDGYLSKPIHQRRLQDMMSRFAPERSVLASAPPRPPVSIATSESPSSESPSSESPSSESPSSESPSSEINDRFTMIDLSAAAGRVPGGKRGLLRLADVFITECNDLMRVLNRSIPDGDPIVVARSAHTLKGSASLFFADAVRESAMKIESQAKSGDLRQTVGDLANLNDQVATMLSELDRFLKSQSPNGTGTNER